MSLATPRDLFVHELADAMSAEQQILKAMPDLQKDAQHPEFKAALKEHEAETRQQVKNLQAVFKSLDEKPEETTCLGMQGLMEEHRAVHAEKPSPEVLELATLSGAEKTEHYEIVAYTGLVQMAKDLGEKEAAQLLQENLDQEKAMAKRVADLTKAISKEVKAAQKEVGAATA
jgi:ferritin-like metal-binding protein YciE